VTFSVCVPPDGISSSLLPASAAETDDVRLFDLLLFPLCDRAVATWLKNAPHRRMPAAFFPLFFSFPLRR